MLNAENIAAIEQATVQAVSPEQVQRWGDWCLPMDHGTVGRARSAVPLHHQAAHWAQGRDVAVCVADIVARYETAGFTPAFRLPDLPVDQPATQAWYAALQAQGFQRYEPSWVLWHDIPALQKSLTLAIDTRDTAAKGEQLTLSLACEPDPAWQAVFLGPGMDVVDGASRVRNLSRAAQTSFVSARTSSGATVACGAASWGYAWLGIHGMRTAVSHQRQGLACRVLAAMAQAAADRGIAHAFLQVGAANTKALALYERLGFQQAWAYAYWRRT